MFGGRTVEVLNTDAEGRLVLADAIAYADAMLDPDGIVDVASGDRLWQMPLVEDYRRLLDSPIADLANVPRESGAAGSIAAALFLREFAGSRPWAHLDVAGAARSNSEEGEQTAGGTGFGTRLLLAWLRKSQSRG